MLELAPKQWRIPEAAPSRFFEGTTLQKMWSANSLEILKACARKYKYKYIEKWVRRTDSVHLLFGGWYADANDLYHQLRAQGATYEFACEEVVEFLLTVTWIDEKPWDSGDSKKTRETLIRSVIWYLDNYKDDPVKTFILADGRPAVELPFQFAIDRIAPTGEPYLLQGKLDRLGLYDENLFVVDQKTTGSTLGAYYFNDFNPHTQMTLYTVASQIVFHAPVSGVIIDAAQIAVGFTAFGRGFTMRSEDQLEEWLEDQSYWIGLAEGYAKSGHYPRNESSCHKYGGCEFRNICSKSPSVRQNFLNTEFTKDES